MTTKGRTAEASTPWASTLGWPLLVVLLLLGHATLMMAAVVMGRTIPAALTAVETDAAQGQNTTSSQEDSR